VRVASDLNLDREFQDAELFHFVIESIEVVFKIAISLLEE
jgi:hypothetical protein